MFLEFNLIKLSLESSFHSFIHSHSQGYTLMPLMCCKNQCSHRCYSLTETSVSAGSLFLTGMTLHKKALKVTPQTKHFNHTSRAWEVAVKYSLYCIFMSCDQSVCILIRINSKTDSLSQQTRGENPNIYINFSIKKEIKMTIHRNFSTSFSQPPLKPTWVHTLHVFFTFEIILPQRKRRKI